MGEGPVFTNDVPRRDNESTWIDPATGWQAVQISHAAKGFGYNISQANDYLAVLPCNKVDYWAQRMAKGDCGDDGAEAIAGMWFDVHSPTKAQQDDALAMLVAEHASNTGTSPALNSSRRLVERAACYGNMEISTEDNTVSEDQLKEAIRYLGSNSLTRLPNKWNSLKLPGVQLSWSSNAGCWFRCNRFEGGSIPSYEEALPFFNRFLKNAKWVDKGWIWDSPVYNSVWFKNAQFGDIYQGVCISSTPKGCING